MKPTAHVSAECLAAYAAGSVPCGTGLLIASHLDYCPACRARVDRLDALGGALMAAEPPVDPDPGCLAKCLAEIEADAAPACCDACLPETLWARLGAGLAEIGWDAVADGVSVHRLSGFGSDEVRLVRAEPGRHLAADAAAPLAVLVLTGRLRDGARLYAAGDFMLLAGRSEIAGTEPCTCLVARASRG